MFSKLKNIFKRISITALAMVITFSGMNYSGLNVINAYAATTYNFNSSNIGSFRCGVHKFASAYSSDSTKNYNMATRKAIADAYSATVYLDGTSAGAEKTRSSLTFKTSNNYRWGIQYPSTSTYTYNFGVMVLESHPIVVPEGQTAVVTFEYQVGSGTSNTADQNSRLHVAAGFCNPKKDIIRSKGGGSFSGSGYQINATTCYPGKILESGTWYPFFRVTANNSTKYYGGNAYLEHFGYDIKYMSGTSNDCEDHNLTYNKYRDVNSHGIYCNTCSKFIAWENHSGGTATCATQATCSICGSKYGSLKNHSYE